MAQLRMCQGGVIYVYIYRSSLYMCASSQAVRRPTSRQQNVEGGSVGGGQV